MNNKEFIQQLSQRMGYTASDTQRMVTNVIDHMSDGFQEGNCVSISGFGNFEIKKKLERIIVNPTTMQRMLVPPKLVLNFKPASTWKDKIKKGGEK
ncbi:MAG: HU family DNA-binding protein [Prevotella sp.]